MSKITSKPVLRLVLCLGAAGATLAAAGCAGQDTTVSTPDQRKDFTVSALNNPDAQKARAAWMAAHNKDMANPAAAAKPAIAPQPAAPAPGG